VGKRRVSCIEGELSTGYPQDELQDLLDVPPFFGEDEPVYHQGAKGILPEVVSPVTQVKTKPGVRLPASPYMLTALEIAAARGDVVTSGNDSSHLPNSLHHDDLAIDVRPAADLQAQIARYRLAGYKVLPEGLTDPATGRYVQLTKDYGTGAHLHISFDPEGKRT
jgi:hypothetical protein